MIEYSIIIPVFGCEKYLEECVGSILRQKGEQEFEIILVDDGSKDKGGEIADALAGQYPQIRAFHKENGGAASARNYGIRQARGKYLLFVDGDDTVGEYLLETVEEVLEHDAQAMIIYGMTFDFYQAGQLQRCETLGCGHRGVFAAEAVLTDFRSFFSDNALSSSCNKVFSADLIRQYDLKFREGMTLYEDYDFVLRYLAHVSSVCCIDKPLYHYRNNLDRPNLNSRVRDLEKLQRNLEQLLDSGWKLAELPRFRSVNAQLLDTTADLYMQLLTAHLMVVAYTKKELEIHLPAYCAQPQFRELLASGARLSEGPQHLLEQIDSGCFRQISREFLKRKRIAAIKKTIKTLLRKMGLRR